MSGFDLEALSKITALEVVVNDLRTKNAVLFEDNAKLRLLVRGLWFCNESTYAPYDCENCPLGVVKGEPLGSACQNLMRELGIEEDA